MTCSYTGPGWRDALYSAVLATEGGITDAARYISDARGKKIHAETLRAKIRHVDGESISLEMVELLAEWMQTKVQGTSASLEWLDALNGRFGRAARQVEIVLESEPGDVSGLLRKIFGFEVDKGEFFAAIHRAAADGQIDKNESAGLLPFIRRLRRVLDQVERWMLRAAGEGAK